MKRLITVIVCFVIIGLCIAREVNKDYTKIKINENTNSSAFENIDKEINPPLIIQGDVLEPEKVKQQAESQLKAKPSKNLELITSEAYLVGDLDTGEVYLEYNTNSVFPIASLSKLFTAVVSERLIKKEDKITIIQPMLDAYGEAGGLVLNEKYTIDELLHPLLLESSNDAAEAMAQFIGYDKFIPAMNSLVLELGMKKTSFKDASGLSSANISNVSDLFSLAKYYYKNEKDILEITKKKEMDFATTTDHGSHHLISINPFVVYEPFLGGKTGRTKEARESMISLFNVKTDKKTFRVAIILLRSDMGEREMDTERIWGKLVKLLNEKQN